MTTQIYCPVDISAYQFETPVIVWDGHCVKQFLDTGSPYLPFEQLVTQLLV